MRIGRSVLCGNRRHPSGVSKPIRQTGLQFLDEVLIASPQAVHIRLPDLRSQKIFVGVLIQKDNLHAGQHSREDGQDT